MTELLSQSAALLFDPGVWLFLFFGVAAGMVIGAIPGLSATMGVALLVPFTFGQELMPALGLLLGVYCGAIYGGTIPAILFRTPGTPAEFSRFCSASVPLARLAKRVFTTDEKLEADLEIAHFGPMPLENAVAEWSLLGPDGLPEACGKQPPQTIPLGNGRTLGRVSIDLGAAPVRAPAAHKLVVGIQGTKIENDWNVWVYPAKVEVPPLAGVMVASALDAAALEALRAGGRVLLLVPPKRVRNDEKNKVALGFSSIFWNTAWTHRQPPTTLGILCDPKHPALAQFPTEFHSDWQWWYLVTRAAPMILDDLPRALRPTVQVIDDWVTAHKLALAFEARAGGGSLLVCSIDLGSGLDANPVARQLRASLLAYVASPAFKPAVELATSDIEKLMCAAPVSQKGE